MILLFLIYITQKNKMFKYLKSMFRKKSIRVFYMRLSNLLPLTGFQRVKFVRKGGVNAEDGCWIGSRVSFDTVHPELITIEKEAIVTAGTTILTHYLDVQQKDIAWRYGKVHIKKRAFIGCNIVICNSVTIGEGAVVGAGSVVTKDIPPYQVWAGTPARYIKEKKH